MKITAKQIKKIIQEELNRLLIESKLQKILSLGHKFTAKDLIDKMEDWTSKNVETVRRRKFYRDNGERVPFDAASGLGKLFFRALINQTSGAKAHDSETFGTQKSGRTPLYRRYEKMKKFIDDSYVGDSTGMSDIMRAADPTGEKQKAGALPRDISPEYSQKVGDRMSKSDILKRHYRK